MESGAPCDTRRELLLKCGLPDTRAPVLIPLFAGRLGPGPLPTSHDDSPSPLTFLPPVVWGPSLEQGSAEMLGLESGEEGGHVGAKPRHAACRGGRRWDLRLEAGGVGGETCKAKGTEDRVPGRASCQTHFPRGRGGRPIPQQPFPPAFLAQKL